MGPTRLYVSLMGEGYKTTIEECKDLFERYKRTFGTAVDWLESQKATARNKLMMVNTSGRKRWWIKPEYGRSKATVLAAIRKKNKGKDLTEDQESEAYKEAEDKCKSAWSGIERAGANFLVQSENVEWTKQAMYEIRKECKKRSYDARMYKEVYDEIVLDAPKTCAEEVHELQKKIMIECGQRRMNKVPVEVEGHLDPCWTK